MPPFFREHPNAMDAIKRYGVVYLKELSIELMHSYLHDSLIPATMKSLGQAFDEDTTSNNNLVKNSVTAVTKESYLRRYGLKCIFNVVGFRYQDRATHYFVDGHEKATTLEYRPAYTKRYLDFEVQAHRWIQFSINESKKLEVQGCVAKDTGYQHYSSSGVDMVEYHVDNVGKMPDVQYGGNLSVRKCLDDPVVVFSAKMRPSSSNSSCHLRCGLDLVVRDHFYLKMRAPV